MLFSPQLLNLTILLYVQVPVEVKQNKKDDYKDYYKVVCKGEHVMVSFLCIIIFVGFLGTPFTCMTPEYKQSNTLAIISVP